MNALSLAACVCRNGSVQADMTNQDSNQVKQGGSSTEQIDRSGVTRIDVPGEGTAIVDADHVISTSSKTLIYLGEKSEGIDIIVEQEGSVVTGRSQEGQDALDAASREESDDGTEGVDDAHAGEKELVTDGGRDISRPAPRKAAGREQAAREARQKRQRQDCETHGRGNAFDAVLAGDQSVLHEFDGDSRSLVEDDDSGSPIMTDGGVRLDVETGGAKGAAMDVRNEQRKRPFRQGLIYPGDALDYRGDSDGEKVTVTEAMSPQLTEPKHYVDERRVTGVTGTCEETGDQFLCDGNHSETMPLDCPVCGAVGGEDAPGCDEQVEQERGQSTLARFGAGGNGGDE